MSHDMKLDGSEAKQLESLSWDVGIAKGIGKRIKHLTMEVCLNRAAAAAIQLSNPEPP